MKKHVEIYFKYHNYALDEFIPCFICGKKAVDIHHIEPKGMGGRSGADVIENLVALCRDCHEKAHANIMKKQDLKSKPNIW